MNLEQGGGQLANLEIRAEIQQKQDRKLDKSYKIQAKKIGEKK